VITEQDAERIAADYLGRPAADATLPWRLMEFPAGWLVRQQYPPRRGRRGAALVIERATGSLVRFPSVLAPVAIIEEYPNVRSWGKVVASRSW
jgi:hypothetical protein